MTTIAFVVDTSASMFQRAYMNGATFTYCDIARQAIERILLGRRKCPESAGDRYMLMSFEAPPNNVKVGWMESPETFREALKNLQFGTPWLHKLGGAIKNTLDYLNRNRLQSGIDTFGHGRLLFKLEPAFIVILAHKPCPYGFNPIDIMQTSTGDFVKDRYRWDQRIFYLGLRIPGTYEQPKFCVFNLPRDNLMEKLCRHTWGRSYNVTSCSMLQHCIQNLLEHLIPGVVLDIALQNGINCQQAVPSKREKCFVAVKKYNGSDGRTPGCWPIPETYHPNIHCEQLPPRKAHPKVIVSFKPIDEPDIVKGFPIDSYQLQNCSLTSRILMKTKCVRKVWPIFLHSKGRVNEKTFGYLKSNSSHSAVMLFVLPYNYPQLLPLLGELIKTHCLQPTPGWFNKFSSYLDTVPRYYCAYLRCVFEHRMKMPQPLVQQILPNHLDDFLSPSVQRHLHRTRKIAQKQQDQFLLHTQKQLATPKHNVVATVNSVFTEKNPNLVPQRDLIDAMGKSRDRFFRPSPPTESPAFSKVVQILPENSRKKKRYVIRDSPYDRHMRNQLKRRAGPISKDFVFKRPTNESERTAGDGEELALSADIFEETETPSTQEVEILPCFEQIEELNTPELSLCDALDE